MNPRWTLRKSRPRRRRRRHRHHPHRRLAGPFGGQLGHRREHLAQAAPRTRNRVAGAAGQLPDVISGRHQGACHVVDVTPGRGVPCRRAHGDVQPARAAHHQRHHALVRAWRTSRAKRWQPDRGGLDDASAWAASRVSFGGQLCRSYSPAVGRPRCRSGPRGRPGRACDRARRTPPGPPGWSGARASTRSRTRPTLTRSAAESPSATPPRSSSGDVRHGWIHDVGAVTASAIAPGSQRSRPAPRPPPGRRGHLARGADTARTRIRAAGQFAQHAEPMKPLRRSHTTRGGFTATASPPGSGTGG